MPESACDIDLLLGMLNAQRRHILAGLDGLTDEQLTAPNLPSQWSLAAMVHHLTWDVERFWFRQVMANEEGALSRLDEVKDGWTIPDGMTPAQVLDEYRAETARVDDLIRRLGLDARYQWWDESLFGGGGPDSMLECVLHVMVETAAHAGQADVVRELIDGRQHMVFT